MPLSETVLSLHDPKVNKPAAAAQSKEAVLQTSCFLAEQSAPKHNGQKGEVVCKTEQHVFRELPVGAFKVTAQAAAFLRAAVTLICLKGKDRAPISTVLNAGGWPFL